MITEENFELIRDEPFLNKVWIEREQQKGIYGPIEYESHSPLEWAGLLAEYVGDYAKQGSSKGSYPEMVIALTKVGAVAMAAYEALRKDMK